MKVSRYNLISLAFTAMNKSRPTLRGVIFDMDGTLTVPNLDFDEMYRRCGVPKDKDILHELSTMEKSKAQAAIKTIEEMEEEGRTTLTLMPGALELSQWLNSHGVKMALVTRNTERTVGTLVSKLWIKNGDVDGGATFSPLIARDSHPDLPFKPHKAAAEYIAKQWLLEIPTNDIVMVGDSPANDIAFGKQSGISTVLLDTCQLYGETGDDGGADFKVEHLWQLPQIFWNSFLIDGPLGSLSNKGLPLKFPAPEPKSKAAVAAVNGDLRALSKLSDHELTSVDETNDNNPIIWASEAGEVEAVDFLLGRCSKLSSFDINARGYLGATAVSRASRRGHMDVLDLLLGRGGADPDIANEKMQFPLHIAAFHKNRHIVSTLLKYGANTLTFDRKGRTPAEDTSDNSIRDIILMARAEQLQLILQQS